MHIDTDLISIKELKKFKTPNTYGENYSKVPKKSGVYFYTTPFYENGILFGYENEKIIYIGSSSNLYNRYSSHELPMKLKNLCKLSFYFFETEFYSKIEIEFINMVKPICNYQHNKGNKILYKDMKNEILKFKKFII
jgi:excinuclease UvrABC nuclease subunit